MRNPLYTRSRPVIRGLNRFSTDKKMIKAHQLRKKLRWKYSYAVPNEKAIKYLVKHSPIVEMGAGLGYWASLVEKEGGNVMCFDKKEPQENEYVTRKEPFHPVRIGTPKVLKNHSEKSLFLCWPSDFNQNEGWSDKALETYLSSGGETLFLVSEGRGGAAGSDRLFDLIDKEMVKIDTIGLPTFPSLHDKLDIFKAK